jgi:hypothetical protein
MSNGMVRMAVSWEFLNRQSDRPFDQFRMSSATEGFNPVPRFV